MRRPLQPQNELPHLFVELGDNAAIRSASVLQVNAADAKRAGKARALITGAKKYQVYRIRQIANGLEFERL